MALPAGKIDIELCRHGGGVEVRIHSSRRLTASQVFVGKAVMETAVSLPALFNVCATAQALTCTNACEAALGLSPPPDVLGERQRLTEVETAKEHLWRMLLDWPRFLGEGPAGPVMARVLAGFRRLIAANNPFRPGYSGGETLLGEHTDALAELNAVATEYVLGMPAAQWLAVVEGPHDLLQWAKTGRTSAARLLREVLERGWAEVGRSPIAVLPRLSARQLEECLGSEGADGFVAEPTWNGTPAETSPFSRNFAHPLVEGLTESFGNGLLPRLAAQLLELALLLRELAAAPEGVRHPEVVVASVLAPGVGLAQGQAARGLLVHRVAVAGERVMDYRILAPTEWNFHPRGVVAAGLAALPSTDVETLRRVASLFVTSVDPCVDYDVIIR